MSAAWGGQAAGSGADELAGLGLPVGGLGELFTRFPDWGSASGASRRGGVRGAAVGRDEGGRDGVGAW